jgi:hypothetical protein
MAGRQPDAADWPDELWYFEKSRFRCRHQWLCACTDFARLHVFDMLAVNRLMVNRRPLGTELAMELTEECRRKRPLRPPGVTLLGT